MAQQIKQGAKRTTARPAELISEAAKAGAKSSVRTPAGAMAPRRAAAPAPVERPVIGLEQERDSLKAALERAHARIKVLEDTQTLVTNRISWVIDTLQTLKNDER